MDKPYVLGLDLGGTNSVFGIVDTRGDIKATTAIKTKGYADVGGYVDAACLALEPVIESVGGIDTIRGMGIGAPNANYYTGTIEEFVNEKIENKQEIFNAAVVGNKGDTSTSDLIMALGYSPRKETVE